MVMGVQRERQKREMLTTVFDPEVTAGGQKVQFGEEVSLGGGLGELTLQPRLT